MRNTLKNGIAYEAQHGVNPFKLGFVGGLDNHNGTPGQSEEIDYARHGAHGSQSFATSSQILNEKFFLGFETNGGGLTVAWAEENSRDSIFSALARRETYATSGTRPVVRFFGGPSVPADICSRGDFAARGYASGVPMGGTLGPGSGAPRFAVSATHGPRLAEPSRAPSSTACRSSRAGSTRAARRRSRCSTSPAAAAA